MNLIPTPLDLQHLMNWLVAVVGVALGLGMLWLLVDQLFADDGGDRDDDQTDEDPANDRVSAAARAAVRLDAAVRAGTDVSRVPVLPGDFIRLVHRGPDHGASPEER